MNIRNKHLAVSLSTCIGIAAALLSPPQALATPLYSLGGMVHTNVPGDSEYRIIYSDIPRTSLDDASTLIGSAGNEATAVYQGSLATASLQARMYATRAWDGDSWVPASAQGSVYFFDVLQFTVPAGSYSAGLYADATGSVKGSIGKSGAGTEVRVQYSARIGGSWGGPGYFEGDIYLGPIDPDQLLIIDEAFVLTTKLLNPGTVLTDPIVVNKEIFAAFGYGAVLGASTWGGKPGAAWAETDFFHTLGFSAITAPAGVIWTSASGQFLNQSVPAPEPETAWLFGSGLFVLTLLRLRGETRRKVT